MATSTPRPQSQIEQRLRHLACRSVDHLVRAGLRHGIELSSATSTAMTGPSPFASIT